MSSAKLSGNEGYWKSRAGSDYRLQQDVRREAGNLSYEQQEALVFDLVSRRAAAGRPISVLDFGCGFGRMSKLLAGITGVTVFAYDFSESMVEDLRRSLVLDSGLENIRLGVADSLAEAFPGQTFDVAIAVSVFIHNAPEAARRHARAVMDALESDGEFVLIENRIACMSLQSSFWHGGCWLHDIAGDVLPGFRIVMDDGLVDGHGVYRVTHPKFGPDVLVARSGGSARSITREDLVLLGMDTVVAAVRALEAEVSDGAHSGPSAKDNDEIVAAMRRIVGSILPSTDAHKGPYGLGSLYTDVEQIRGRWRVMEAQLARKDHDIRLCESQRDDAVARALDLERDHSAITARMTSSLEAIGRLERDNAAALERIAALERDLEVARASALRARAREENLEIRLGGAMRGLGRLVRPYPESQLSIERHSVRAATHPLAYPKIAYRSVSTSWFEVNASRDTRFANADARFDRVAHVFHQQWFGMRAAAGALPGQKFAISADRRPTQPELVAFGEALARLQIDRVVCHGFSESMADTSRFLASAIGIRPHLVWHGAPAMWVWEAERKLFGMVVSLAEAGVLRRVHIMRSGNASLVGSAGWAPQLLNMPPNVSGVMLRSDDEERATRALLPSWNLVHKNVYSNLAAASLIPSIDKIWVLASDIDLPVADSRLERLPTLDQVAMLGFMAKSALTMNVSLVDCHPMVELESMAVGTPALRGPLALDQLDDHEYVRLTEVKNPLSVEEIRRTAVAVLEFDRLSMRELIGDYRKHLTAASARGFLDFISD